MLATSKGGRTLVAFGWVNVRICDAAGVKAATVCSLDLQREIKADPDLMDFVDLNYYGPAQTSAQAFMNELLIAEMKRRREHLRTR